MRVTTGLMFSSGLVALQNQQEEMLHIQGQSSTGNRANKPSDDPTATFRHMLFTSDLSEVSSLKRTTELASQRLALGDSNINQMHDRLLDAQDLVMKMSSSEVNGDPSILEAASLEALAIYQEMLQSANQDMDEVPLFGGGRTRNPFDESVVGATRVRGQAANNGHIVDVKVGADIENAIDLSSAGNIVTDAVAATDVAAGNQAAVVSAIEAGVAAGDDAATITSAAMAADPDGRLTLGEARVITAAALAESTATAGYEVSAAARAAADADVDAVQATIADGTTFDEVPLSVQLTYEALSNTYSLNVNGVTRLDPVIPSADNPPVLDLQNGITVTMGNSPQEGDRYYFEVVPKYQGGSADRSVRILGGKTLPGNVTGEELIEGSGDIGRGKNLFGILAAVRGALLRGDTTEVAHQLDQVREARAQVSDLQSLTGIRNVQVDAVTETLNIDEVALQEVKATNIEVDLFDILSRLEQTSQAMQVMTTVERQVLNTSIMDFIR